MTEYQQCEAAMDEIDTAIRTYLPGDTPDGDRRAARDALAILRHRLAYYRAPADVAAVMRLPGIAARERANANPSGALVIDAMLDAWDNLEGRWDPGTAARLVLRQLGWARVNAPASNISGWIGPAVVRP